MSADRALTAEERNRTTKAAVLFATALRQNATVEQLMEEPTRQRVLAGTKWDGASVACWEMVVAFLAVMEEDSMRVVRPA